MPEEITERIVTGAQRVPAWAMVRAVAARRGLMMLVTAAVIPMGALAVALLTGDLRWALVALMLLFVVMPMALLLVYFSYVLRPDVARAVLPHRLTIEPGRSVTIEYLPDEAMVADRGDDADTGNDKCASKHTVPAEDSARPPRCLPPDETIPWERVTLLRHTPRYWLLLHD